MDLHFASFWAVVAAALVTCHSEANGQEWTRFRGPNGTGLSSGSAIPSQWGEKDIAWKTELPGIGHSSPVVWETKLFLTSAVEQGARVSLHCIQTTSGKVTWTRDLDLSAHPLHRYNGSASSTPTVDAQHVYLIRVSQGHCKLMALDHSGRDAWERDFGPFKTQHGLGASPIVHGGKVILTVDQDGESSVLALDAITGKTVWTAPLSGNRADYGTPCLFQTDQGKSAVLFNSMEDGVLALDETTGTTLWKFEKAFTQRCVSSPVVAAGLIIGTCGSGGGGNYVAAVRPPDGASKAPAMAYSIRRSAPYVPTPLALDGLLFLWGDGGIVTCADAASGNIHWQERVGGNFFASPIGIDRRIFGASAEGEVIVLEASPSFRLLARNKLDEGTHATPAVNNGRLYLRTFHHLLAIGGGK